MQHSDTTITPPALPAGRRSDAGTIRLTGRDIAGLVLCGEQYGATPAALTALRTRHIQLLTELEAERADITAKLAAITAPADDDPGDPALLDQLPILPGILNHAPERLTQQLLTAFDVQAIYHRKDHQVTIRATITTSTPGAVLAIIADAAALNPQPPPPPPASTH